MKFITTPTELQIILERTEQIAALKAKVAVSRKQITALTWHDTFKDWRRWEVRLPGAAIPGRLIAGSYWTESGWDFFYLKRPVGVRRVIVPDVICIELQGHEKYERIAISATKEDFAHLEEWYKKGAKRG